MSDNVELTFVASKPLKLTENTLRRKVEWIEDKFKVKVEKVCESENGYIFKGKYGFTIGDITWDSQRGVYRSFNFHHGVKESITERDEYLKRQKSNPKRKYKVQRNKRIGVRFAAASIAVLISIGVIKTAVSHRQADTPTSGVVAVLEEHANNVVSANDLIILSWANYAMGEVDKVCSASEYDGVRSMRDEFYADCFAPVMTDYYNYLDQIDSGLPVEIIGETMEKYHDSYRSKAYAFDESLKNGYFDRFSFSNSPFADAIVVDKNGNMVSSNSRYSGEVKASDGTLLTLDDSGEYVVYILATDVPSNDYTVGNLPDDARIFDGNAYVDANHYDDFLDKGKTNNK